MGKLRLGFIGVGGISHIHARQMLELQEEVELAAAADPSETNLAAFIATFGLTGLRAFPDHRAMLAAAQPDAVVICSPHALHYGQASDALSAGAHVLIEKPMTCSSAEAERLIALANRTGRVLQISYQRHFQPEYEYIRRIVAEGAVGRLTSVTASLYQGWLRGTAGTWRQIPELSGGGMLMDSGSHIIDMLLWTTGLQPAGAKSTVHRQGAPVEIDSFSSIVFEEGAVAGLNVIGHAPVWHETFVYSGEEGGIYLENGNIRLFRSGRGKEGFVPELPARTTNQDRSFIDTIRGRCDNPVPGRFGLKVVRLTEMIYRAAGYDPLKPGDAGEVVDAGNANDAGNASDVGANDAGHAGGGSV